MPIGIGYKYCNGGDPCPGDFDESGDYTVNDILFMISAWGTSDGDVDGDGLTGCRGHPLHPQCLWRRLLIGILDPEQ